MHPWAILKMHKLHFFRAAFPIGSLHMVVSPETYEQNPDSQRAQLIDPDPGYPSQEKTIAIVKSLFFKSVVFKSSRKPHHDSLSLSHGGLKFY